MKKILFLTPQLPYPPISGGTIKSWKMVEFLSQNYIIGLGCLLKNEDCKYLAEFKRFFYFEDFVWEVVKKERSIPIYIKSLIVKKPLAVYRNYSLTFKEKVLSIVNKYNIIIVDHYVMFQYVPENFNGKIILHEHNAEYILWERFAQNEKNILKKIIGKIETMRVKKYELCISALANKILCVSLNDIENLKKVGVQENKIELLMSVGDEILLKKEDLKFEDTENALLFIGTLTWEPNIDGLIWFIENGWEKLKKKIPLVKFYIIGKNPPEKLKNLVKKYSDIILTGFVENLEDYYKKCRVFVAPLRYGSGIKIKNINAMYRGIPLVTTSIGAEGIEGKDGIHFMIGDTINSLIDKILILMNNKDLWEKISKNSRKLMKEKYTWEIVLNKFKSIIDIL